MKRAAFALSLLILSSLSSIAQAGAIAKVVALYGSPTASGRALVAGSDIQEHDKIAVGSGNVQILFTDGTKLVLGSGSTLVIEKYLMRGGNVAQNVTIDALRGTFRFITGNSPKKNYHLKTSNATIGIRGTGFDFWVNDKTGVAVLEGKVKLCRSGSTNNQNNCVELAAGCQAGIAEPGNTHLLKSNSLSFAIRAHFPYIINQSSLRPKFRLPVEACSRVLDLTEPSQGNSTRNSEPPPPPPTECEQTCREVCTQNYDGEGQSCTQQCSCD
jgi:FecR protein